MFDRCSTSFWPVFACWRRAATKMANYRSNNGQILIKIWLAAFDPYRSFDQPFDPCSTGVGPVLDRCLTGVWPAFDPVFGQRGFTLF